MSKQTTLLDLVAVCQVYQSRPALVTEFNTFKNNRIKYLRVVNVSWKLVQFERGIPTPKAKPNTVFSHTGNVTVEAEVIKIDTVKVSADSGLLRYYWKVELGPITCSRGK